MNSKLYLLFFLVLFSCGYSNTDKKLKQLTIYHRCQNCDNSYFINCYIFRNGKRTIGRFNQTYQSDSGIYFKIYYPDSIKIPIDSKVCYSTGAFGNTSIVEIYPSSNILNLKDGDTLVTLSKNQLILAKNLSISQKDSLLKIIKKNPLIILADSIFFAEKIIPN